jgi:hypothetical protein
MLGLHQISCACMIHVSPHLHASLIIIIIIMFSYRKFSFLWYFPSWENGETHHSGFKSQLVALSLWCVMFLVRRFFLHNLLNVVLVLFPDIFKTFTYSSRGPVITGTGMKKHFWSTFPEFLYSDSYALISSQLYYYYYYYYYYALLIAQYSQGYWSHFAPCHTSRRKPGIANKAHHVGFVVNKVAMGQVLLQVLRVPCK